MRYRFSKDEITVRNNNGAWILSIMLDGQRIEQTYIFYSKEEAIRKFQQDFGTYPNDYTPVGVLTLSNFGGLAIMKIEYGIEYYVHVTANYGDGYKNLTRNKIYYNHKRAYFIRHGKRYYLDEFMKL